MFSSTSSHLGSREPLLEWEVEKLGLSKPVAESRLYGNTAKGKDQEDLFKLEVRTGTTVLVVKEA